MPRATLLRAESGALGLIATVFLIDLATPLGVAAAVPYTFAVLLAFNSSRRWFAPATAALCGILTIAKMEIMPDRGTTEMWKVIANRCLALFAIGMTAFLGLRRKQAEDKRNEAVLLVREHLADLARMGRLNTAGQLAAGLAHELNQPLSAVCLQAELAERLAANGKDPKQLAPMLAEIAEQSQRAAEIVRGLRRMLRHDAAAPADVDMNEVVASVVRLLESQATRREVEVQINRGPIPVVNADRVQLEQVVFNLVQNAIEAVGDSATRRVTVATTLEGEYVCVAVHDTGAGLPPGDEARLFERFFTTKPEGMGMGLAISRSIVEGHGGRILAEQLPEGGARFAFSIPVTRRP
jgi:C4-dicarboxylate-specific signal transduction histidine kinase